MPSLIERECRKDGCVPPSRLFPKIRQQFGDLRADRIIALMGNGVSLSSAITATERVTMII